eukprot:1039146-Pyramimonas_sp.AAC.1
MDEEDVEVNLGIRSTNSKEKYEGPRAISTIAWFDFYRAWEKEQRGSRSGRRCSRRRGRHHR